ncbi:membrane protein [Alcaligenes pakistanensis]|uniref:Membrane protein n=1 Tax=Alcaligenes pakistanensis TaxID=1482717 RepID=A0A8H9IMA4_9BURK|nr:TerC family protein [Alcaligenes pakistanensis]MBP6622052.1 TerC family protein [Alcaligenes sp.]GHC41795.1 membrane protein [Alcaligenes pakistanensis]HCA18448.1 TerC family protein [Alcaligenes faecalis]
MEWLLDPSIWVGLLTLVVLEIVLGIDNLIFIAILADKLPPHQRDRARLIGLSLALIMRLGLLTIVSWLVTLTTPLFSLGPLSFSGRDLILLLGGLFLLFKATSELHERLEGSGHHASTNKAYASFGVVVAQIVVLDAVFSLDAVITAVGMVDELPVMMTAVIISIGLMIWASKPLTTFVNNHPTVVVLCLSFLLMIGLTLTAEGLGFKIPKGYLYAAIGFSILIEFFNQIARRSLQRSQSRRPLRDRTAEAVLRMLGNRNKEDKDDSHNDGQLELDEQGFRTEERNMVSGVLSLAERPIRSLMTPRQEITWLDIDDSTETLRQQLRSTPHSFLPVCQGDLDQVVGVARAKDLLADLDDYPQIQLWPDLREPIIVHEHTDVLSAIAMLKQSNGQFVLVTDEYGAIEGLLTPIDILEAIAGEFPDEDEQAAIQQIGPNLWQVDGGIDLLLLAQAVEADDLLLKDSSFNSVAGFLLERLDSLPTVGTVVEADGLRFEVTEVSQRRIATVHVSRLHAPEERQD